VIREVDTDRDGVIDRWEIFDLGGRLVRVGRSTRPGLRPDLWTDLDVRGAERRREHDDDGDGLPDRAEVWTEGRLVAEEFATRGDGRFKRRLVRGPDGRVVRVETDIDGDGLSRRRSRGAVRRRLRQRSSERSLATRPVVTDTTLTAWTGGNHGGGQGNVYHDLDRPLRRASRDMGHDQGSLSLASFPPSGGHLDCLAVLAKGPGETPLTFSLLSAFVVGLRRHSVPGGRLARPAAGLITPMQAARRHTSFLPSAARSRGGITITLIALIPLRVRATTDVSSSLAWSLLPRWRWWLRSADDVRCVTLVKLTVQTMASLRFATPVPDRGFVESARGTIHVGALAIPLTVPGRGHEQRLQPGRWTRRWPPDSA
jgi:hypothetical protein